MSKQKTNVLKGEQQLNFKINDTEISIEPNDYYVLSNNPNKKLIKNNKLNELANQFNIEIIDYEILSDKLINNNLFEYIIKVTVEVNDHKFISLGESNERNLIGEIALNFRGTMAQIRGEGRAIIKALKYLGIEGDFYSENEFEVNIINNTSSKNVTSNQNNTSNLTKNNNSTSKTNNTNSIKDNKQENKQTNLSVEEIELLNNPGSYVIKLGKCKNLTIKEVYERDIWMFNHYISSLEGKTTNKNPLTLEAGKYAKLYRDKFFEK